MRPPRGFSGTAAYAHFANVTGTRGRGAAASRQDQTLVPPPEAAVQCPVKLGVGNPRRVSQDQGRLRGVGFQYMPELADDDPKILGVSGIRCAQTALSRFA